VYQVEASRALLKPRTWAPRAARLAVPRNVFLLGTVSLLTDVSAEMVATVLPLYLVFSLGVTPLAVGAIDGLYRGAWGRSARSSPPTGSARASAPRRAMR
jgi:hypothetical protein